MLTAPCRFATIRNITLSGLQTVDGIAAAVGDRVLVKDQMMATTNGIYVVSTSAWVRASDLVGVLGDKEGTFVPVNQGAKNAATLWLATRASPWPWPANWPSEQAPWPWEGPGPGPIRIGTDLLTFRRAVSTGVFLPKAGPLTVTRAAQDKMRDVVSVRDFGAVGDSVTDDTRGIQAAIDSGENAIYFPAGTYKISAPINIPTGRGMHLYGAGFGETVLQGSGSFRGALLNIGSDDPVTQWGTIEDMRIAGGPDVDWDYGIYGTHVAHFTFRRIWCTGFRRAGISIGYGWCNDFLDSDFSYNYGHGLELNAENRIYGGGGHNAINIRNCKIYANYRHGIFARGGYGIWTDGCTLEANGAGAIFLAAVQAFSISNCYFELNACDQEDHGLPGPGYLFAEPSRTVMADIVLCGAGTDRVMSSAYACKGVMSDCSVSSTHTTVFVYDAGAVDCSVRSCVRVHGTPALIGWEYAPGYRGFAWNVESCSSFPVLISELNSGDYPDTGSTSALTRLRAPYFLTPDIDAPSPLVPLADHRNYANVDFNTWTLLAAGSASTYRKSEAPGPPQQFWNGLPIWSINSTAPGSSHIFGMRLASSAYPALIGRLMWYGIWRYAPDGTGAYAQPYCNQQRFTSSTHPSEAWIFEAVSFVWPDAGDVMCGIYKSGVLAGDIYFAAPMLMEVGTPMNEALQTIPMWPHTWRGQAAPTGGLWSVGDTVVNSAPTAGGATGWVCVAAGTPGTWKAMANLAP